MTQDQLLGLVLAPLLNPALQRSQLCLASVSIRNHGRQPIHHLFGRCSGFGCEPPINDRPYVLEGIGSASPPMRCARFLAMRWPYFAGLPGGAQAAQKGSDIGDRRRQSRDLRGTVRMIRQHLLGGTDLLQQLDRIQRAKLRSQSDFDRLAHVRPFEQPIAGGLWRVIALFNAGPVAGLGLELERRLKEIDVQP